ncbi:MAG: hypothetical protein OXE73_02045 [Gammaproteobacteria bacterium]|nr:hypothetical protein [Gammaproteobacteria bacterium]
MIRRRHRSSSTSVAILILTLAAITGCADGSTPTRGDLTISIDTVGNIIRVSNTGTPLDWRLVPVASFGPKSLAETGAAEEFGRVNSVAVGPDGPLFVADGLNHEVRVFGLDGVHRRTFGRNGEGPGEFRSLYSLAWVGDRLLTLDPNLGRIGEFSAEGEWLGQQRIEGSVSGPVDHIRFRPVSADRVYRLGYMRHATGVTSVLVGHDSRGETGDTLSWLQPPPESTGIILCRHDPLITFFDIPFGSRLVQYPGADGVHYSAMTDAYRIAVTRNATDTLRLIERSLREERISDEEWTAGIRDFEEFLVENPNASCDPRRPSRPARKPFIEDIFLAPDGTLWVEVIRSAGNRLEVFDPEGRLLGSLPARSRKEGSVPAFGAGHLVTVRRDSLDLDHVDVWRIERAGRGTRGAIIDRL